MPKTAIQNHGILSFCYVGILLLFYVVSAIFFARAFFIARYIVLYERIRKSS